MINMDLKKNMFLKFKFSIFLRFLFNLVSKLERLTNSNFLLLLDFILIIIAYIIKFFQRYRRLPIALFGNMDNSNNDSYKFIIFAN